MNLNNRFCHALTLLSVAYLATSPASAQITKGKTLRVMAVGDSITLGITVGGGGYRQKIQNYLSYGGYSYQFVGKEDDGNVANDTGYSAGMSQPNHEGYGGFLINQITDGGSGSGRTSPPIAQTLATYTPDVVLLMIGTNDVLRNYDPSGTGYNAANAASRLDTLVNTIFTDAPGVTLALSSIIPLSDAGQEARAKQYNALIPGIISKYQGMGDHVVFADMHGAVPSSTLVDGIHPNEFGYRVMADTYYKALTGSAPPLPPAKPFAAGAGITLSGATFQANTQNFSLGYSFTTGGAPVTVTDLGYINDGSNTSHDVGIFRGSDHALVARAQVSVGATRDATQFSYAHLITPVVLDPGTLYDIQGTELGFGFFSNARGFSVSDAVTYGVANYSNSSSLTAPTGYAPGNYPGNFGPNFLVKESVAVVPEAGSVSLLLSGVLALGGAVIAARKRASRSLG